jgi:hypothetical protein
MKAKNFMGIMKSKKVSLKNLTKNEKWKKLLSLEGLGPFLIRNIISENKENPDLQVFFQPDLNEKAIINEILKKDFTSLVPMEARIAILDLISSYYYEDLKERYRN